jgi:exopolyphosphatase/guanosine-5'-triphosphate,3'-diphosphate pyrophosphatase
VGPERADFVLPGCAIFEAIRRVWPASQVMVADRGLREGMLLRLMRERSAVRAGLRPDRFRQGVAIQA